MTKLVQMRLPDTALANIAEIGGLQGIKNRTRIVIASLELGAMVIRTIRSEGGQIHIVSKDGTVKNLHII